MDIDAFRKKEELERIKRSLVHAKNLLNMNVSCKNSTFYNIIDDLQKAYQIINSHTEEK